MVAKNVNTDAASDEIADGHHPVNEPKNPEKKLHAVTETDEDLKTEPLPRSVRVKKFLAKNRITAGAAVLGLIAVGVLVIRNRSVEDVEEQDITV